jgi:DNA-binding NarL/FixJ family response regulator
MRAFLDGSASTFEIERIKSSITEDTVKGQVRNILSKLGANDRTHAAMIGLKRGIIEF